MTQRTFDLIQAINCEGLDNGLWDVVSDISSIRDYFGTEEKMPLHGQWIAIWKASFETLSFIEKIQPDLVAHVKDSSIKGCKLLLYKIE